MRWTVGVGAAIMSAIGLVLLFLLTLATNNRALYERNYAWLFGVNVVVAVLLLAVLVWVGVRLVVRLRRGRFGSRLLVKLAAIFALVGLLPGLLIYVVSYQFVSRSIESWFDVKVEGALVAGVNLAPRHAGFHGQRHGRARAPPARSWPRCPMPPPGLVLERIRDQLGASDVVLWNAAGHAVASAGQSRFQLNPERPSAQQLRTVRQQRAMTQIEGLDDLTDTPLRRMPASRCWRWSPAPGVGLLAEPRFLQVTMPLPAGAGGQRHRGARGQPRIPGARPGA